MKKCRYYQCYLKLPFLNTCHLSPNWAFIFVIELAIPVVINLVLLKFFYPYTRTFFHWLLEREREREKREEERRGEGREGERKGEERDINARDKHRSVASCTCLGA